MLFCGLCNGINNESHICHACGNPLKDEGKIYDFYDDYSPYMEIDWNKLVDGVADSANKEECAHLFICPNCGEDQLKIIHYGKK